MKAGLQAYEGLDFSKLDCHVQGRGRPRIARRPLPLIEGAALQYRRAPEIAALENVALTNNANLQCCIIPEASGNCSEPVLFNLATQVKRRRPLERVGSPDELLVTKLRTALQMTQEQFATQFHFSAGAIRDWEQGRSKPSRLTLARLERIAETLASGLMDKGP